MGHSAGAYLCCLLLQMPELILCEGLGLLDLNRHACEGHRTAQCCARQGEQAQGQHGSPARHSQFPENGCLAIIAIGSGQSV